MSLTPDVKSQSIVYGQFPATSPIIFPYDANGTRVLGELGFPAQTFNLNINGQTAFTFASDGTGFVIQPSTLNAVIAVQPNLANNPLDPSTFPVPLAAGQQIGPDAAGYTWLGNILGGDTLTASRNGGIIGQPPLTTGLFTGVESAYIGLQFQESGLTYYGWVRAGAPAVGLNGGWIYDYAYETSPNTSIFTGEVPEPGTCAVLIGGGLLLWISGRLRHAVVK